MRVADTAIIDREPDTEEFLAEYNDSYRSGERSASAWIVAYENHINPGPTK